MSDQDNARYTQAIANLFDALAGGYDCAANRFFPFTADQLVDWLALRPGQRVLDIGTGTGVAAVAAAQQIRPEGRVQAVDVAEQMLDIGMANARRMALDNIDWHVMDAAYLEFKADYFDVAISAFSLFFIPDWRTVVGRWQRVLKPGATLAVATFERGAFQPMLGILRRQLREQGVELPPGDDPDSWFPLATPEACQSLLEEAGYVDVEVRQIQVGYHVERVLDWWEVISSTAFRAFVEQLDEPRQIALQQAHLNQVEQFFNDGKLWIDIPVLLTRARRPEK